MRLRLGILLDSWNVRSWQASVIKHIIGQPHCEVAFVALNKCGNIPTSRRSKFAYTWGRRLDRRLFRSANDCFDVVDVRELFSSTVILIVEPISRRYTDAFSEADILRINATDPDIVVRFGFRILTGDVLNVGKYGVWSLHHGDTAVNRGGPPGFWELATGESVTGVTLQVLSDELDGGRVIEKAFIRTNWTSFNRNQNDLFWAGVELFCNCIDRQSRDPAFYLNGRWNEKFYSRALYRDPSNLLSLKIFLRFWASRLVGLIARGSKQWKIYIKFGLEQPDCTLFKFKPLQQPSNLDWADPFIIFRDNTYYLFFEELEIGSGKGHIALLKFDLSGHLLTEQPLRVLEQGFHLSYPFVFEYDERFYMTPECGDDHRVWLYRAHSFPTDWRKERILIDRELFDPTLYQHNGVWYLFATERPFKGCSPDQYLVIYYTDDLLHGEWTRHPKSPCVRDVRFARPAGRIFKDKGLILRPAQIGAPNYGHGIVFMQITLLTKVDYEEEHHDQILPHWHDGIRGVHTFNHVKGLTVVDAQVHI